MLNITTDLFCTAIEATSNFIFYTKLTNTHHNKPCRIFALYFILTLANWLVTLKFPSAPGWLLLVAVQLFIVMYIFKKRLFEAIAIYGIDYLIGAMEEGVLLTIFTALHIPDNAYSAILGCTFSFFIMVAISLLTPINKLYTLVANGNIFARLLLFNLFLVYLMDVGLTKYSSIDTAIYRPILLTFSLVILLEDYTILKQQRTIEHQKESLDNYYTYEPMLQELIQDVRGKQHDFDNHMNAIRMLPLANADYDALKSALMNYSDNMIDDYRESALLRINMHVLSGLIFSKIKDAERRGRQLIVSVANSELSTSMPEYELIRVVGIMIDNALEAVPDGGTASLNVDSRDGKVMISTLNTGPVITPELRRMMFTAGYTTKTDKSKKHGYGLSNLKAKVKQYNGTIYLENTYIEGEPYIRFEIVV